MNRIFVQNMGCTSPPPLSVPGNEFVYEFPLYSITTLKLAVR